MTRSIDLYELQETDTALDAAERRLGEIAQELESESGLDALDEAIAAADVELSSAESERREANAEVIDQKEKISALEEKLYSGEVRNPKELKALQDDVEAHQQHLSVLEERALTAEERVEQAKATQKLARDDREQRMQEREILFTSLEAEKASINSELEQLNQIRNRQKERVDNPDLQLYERLRRARAGRAVSKVERGTCQGCRITLPTTVFQRARSGLKIVQCTSCERILYVV
jgi:predicted  nucleic acid-binding Zn-ribbon protein